MNKMCISRMFWHIYIFFDLYLCIRKKTSTETKHKKKVHTVSLKKELYSLINGGGHGFVITLYKINSSGEKAGLIFLRVCCLNHFRSLFWPWFGPCSKWIDPSGCYCCQILLAQTGRTTSVVCSNFAEAELLIENIFQLMCYKALINSNGGYCVIEVKTSALIYAIWNDNYKHEYYW